MIATPAYKGQPWGTYGRKDIKIGDVVVLRWIDGKDTVGMLVELDKHPANFKGDISGQYFSSKGALESFDTLQQIVEIRGNLLDMIS